MRALAVFALCGATAVTLGGQQQSERPPTFRAGVELVEVDVYVTDRDGAPVRGLTIDDFEVFENGKPRPITAFAPVEIPVLAREPVWADAESDIGTNTGPDGRIYLIMLDGTLEVEEAMLARQRLHPFIKEHFGENDLAAVVSDHGLVTDGQDFTNNKRLLLTAIDKFMGGGRDMRHRDLRERIELLARMPGHRKVILWFTRKIHFDPHLIMDYQGGVPSLADEQAHAAMSAATRGNIRIYPIHPVAHAGGLEDKMDFRGVAELTGGFAHIGSNDYSGTFERLVRETGTYYVLGFESSIQAKQGRYVRFEVRTKRPGLTVSSRPGYVEQLEYIRKTTKPEPTRTPAAAALANPVASPGVPMRVHAAAFRQPNGSQANVALSVDLDPSALLFAEKDGQFTANLELRQVATDAKNVVYPEFKHSTAMTVSAEDYRRLTERGLRIVSQVELPKGRFQIRFASASNERAGNVVQDLEIPDFREAPLSMSGVALTSTSAATAVTLQATARGGKTSKCRPPRCSGDVRTGSALIRWAPQSNDTDPLVWKDALPAPPTTLREFKSTETVTAFFEVYDNNRRVNDDPLYAIEATATLRGSGPDAIRAVTEKRVSRDPRRASGGHGLTMSVPLAGIPAGPYVLEIEASTARLGVEPIRRRIPISVKE